MARSPSTLAFTFALALGSLLASCGPQTYVIQQYDGPVRELSSIAILRINGDDSVRILALDGDHADPRLEDDTRLHIELLPGPHTVRVASVKHPNVNPQSLSFEAEAGRVYRAVLHPSFGAFDFDGRPTSSGAPRSIDPLGADVFEVERGSDRPVRSVTTRPPAPAGVVPPPSPLPAPIAAPDPVSPAQPAPAPSTPLTPTAASSVRPAPSSAPPPPPAPPPSARPIPTPGPTPPPVPSPSPPAPPLP